MIEFFKKFFLDAISRAKINLKINLNGYRALLINAEDQKFIKFGGFISIFRYKFFIGFFFFFFFF